MTWNYMGFNTSAPSWVTAELAAVEEMLKYKNPSWTWGDVKSVLRTTASCWTSGYGLTCGSGSSIGFGYGNINYVAANSYSGTIYLQPPGLTVTTATYGPSPSYVNSDTGTEAIFALYPFMTSRRAGEVIYAFSQQPVFPSPSSMNEYTYAQISSLLDAYGGSLIYSSGGASGVQTPLPYAPSITGTVYFVAFTVDSSNLAAANFSRAEQAFSVLSENLNPPQPPPPPVNPAAFYGSNPAAYVPIFQALKVL